jgi:hypothetical protein
LLNVIEAITREKNKGKKGNVFIVKFLYNFTLLYLHSGFAVYRYRSEALNSYSFCFVFPLSDQLYTASKHKRNMFISVFSYLLYRSFLNLVGVSEHFLVLQHKAYIINGPKTKEI